MSKIYCPECGKSNEHSGVKPKFCGFCQAALDEIQGGTALRAPRKSTFGRRPIRRPIETDDIDDEEFSGSLPDINKLDVEVVMTPIHRETVGDVIGSEASGEPVKKGRGNKFVVKLDKKKAQPINSQQILNDFQHRIFDIKRIDLNPND